MTIDNEPSARPIDWRPAPAKVLGSHFLIELLDCDPATLRWADDVEAIMRRAAERSNAGIVNAAFHQFQPEGASGVILIRWSHFSIHTWPEEGYAAADIFTCGDEMDPELAIEVMTEGFAARTVRRTEIPRGV